MASRLVKPHGDKLVNLYVTEERREELRQDSRDCPSWPLTARQLCDLELMLDGALSPLTGFMTQADYDPVCASMRQSDGTLWPLPVTLGVSDELGSKLSKGDMLALRDPEGVMLAGLHVDDLWKPDLQAEARACYGTDSPEHPAVAQLLAEAPAWYVGGSIEGVQRPIHYDFRALRLTPDELRAELIRRGWRRVAAFLPRQPMHRAQHELTMRAAKEVKANLLLHPMVGHTNPDDGNHYTRIRCYEALLRHYPQHTTRLALLPLATRQAGPREALWHAIIQKNFGCSHLIVGRDHAGAGVDRSGKPFYGAYDAHALLAEHEKELGITAVPFKNLVYVEDLDKYVTEEAVPDGARTLSISPTGLRSRLAEGREIPEWFTFPAVAQELQRRNPPRYRQGFTVFFTGLSGAGKSTIANVLLIKLLEMGGRPVTLLDGDIVRRNLSSELGFSKEHRDLNILRIGFVASEITKNRGIALCAPIAPYHNVRKQVREMIEPLGGFILVHVATPLDVCELRDRKGLYAKARAGIIKKVTGISDPYEEPEDADVLVNTAELTPEEACQEVLLYLEKQAYVGAEGALR